MIINSKFKHTKPTIGVIIIAKDEEEKIEGCLKSVLWADEIVVVDTGSEDGTLDICNRYPVKIVKCLYGKYSHWRNFGLKAVKSEWILYVDADERVSDGLKLEIQTVVGKNINNAGCYAIPRRNIILGKEMHYGGWWPDYVKRLFPRSRLLKWVGDLHEEPKYRGDIKHLKNPLIHQKHSNLFEMVEKTNIWSDTEAELLFDSGHPKMVWWRFIRIMASELWLRLFKLKGFKDGPEGIIYAFYQMYSRFITYAKLWELQIVNSKSENRIAKQIPKYNS